MASQTESRRRPRHARDRSTVFQIDLFSRARRRVVRDRHGRPRIPDRRARRCAGEFVEAAALARADSRKHRATAGAARRRAAMRRAWTPLKHPLFRAMWIASVVSNVGTWMHTVAASWLMTQLATSPLPVALVQTATTLPVFLISLPAGALADLVDRRRWLIFTQSLMLAIAALL